MKARTTPKLKRYKTARLLWKRHCKPYMNHFGTKDITEIIYGGKEYEAVIADVESNGFWGFYDTNTQTIHYWHDNKRSIMDMIGFFAHEMQHHVDDHWPKCYSKKKIIQEEHRADIACEVARIAYVLARGTAA